MVTDNWDDFFEYETLFRATYFDENQNPIYLGEVKIGAKESKITRQVIELSFKKLSKNFCSLGQELAYYENLNKIGNRRTINDIIFSLNDMAFNENIFRDFSKNVSLMYNSLMRFSEAKKAYDEAKAIIDNRKQEKVFYFKFKTQIEGFSGEHEVEFDFRGEGNLPNRINVLVGGNGTGKTNLLAKLANKLSGITKEDNTDFTMEETKFSRVIAISYSAFDNFNKIFNENYIELMLGYAQKFKELIKKSRIELEKNNSFKNLLEIIEEDIVTIEDNDISQKIINQKKEGRSFSYVYCGILNSEGIIAREELYENFQYRLDGLKNKGRFNIFYEALKEIIDDEIVIMRLNEKKILDRKEFEYLSSGQATNLFVLTSIVCNIENESLLIFDEPEIHLHPNAISSLMRMINKILNEFNAYAIIATHSPIIVQEIPSKYVRVLNRIENSIPVVKELQEEYFGDNITSIVNDIFQVRDYESNYKTILKELKDRGYTKDEIFVMFEEKLSFNANIYLNTICKEDRKLRI